MVTLTGSAILGLAVLRGHLSAEAAWAAAHVDEDWQIARWGEDAEASARRARRWADMRTAADFLLHLD
jgi:chaperone required for assembly of F1-ATPase